MLEIVLIVLCTTAAKRWREAGEKGVSKYIVGVWASLLGCLFIGAMLAAGMGSPGIMVFFGLAGYVTAFIIAISAMKAGKGYLDYHNSQKSQQESSQAAATSTQDTSTPPIPAEVVQKDLKPAQWARNANSQGTYYSLKADSLVQAAEILKHIPSIPPLTYYMVDTSDGTLGRDTVGFFTEGPLKTTRLKTAYRRYSKRGGPTEAQSLMNYGDAIKAQSTVAALKSHGQYAKFILMMKCGHCGYESPIETTEGDLERECYFCGTNNKTHRASVNVYTPQGVVEI